MKKVIITSIVFFTLVLNITTCGSNKGNVVERDAGKPSEKPPVVLSVNPKLISGGEAVMLSMAGKNFSADMEVRLGDGISVGQPTVTGKGRQAVMTVTVNANAKPGERDVIVKNAAGESSGDCVITIAKKADTNINTQSSTGGIRPHTDLRAYRDNLAKYSSYSINSVAHGYFTDTFIPFGKDKDLVRNFRWSTTVEDVDEAVWQVSSQPFKDDLMKGQNWRAPEGLAAYGTLSSVPGEGKHKDFTIDFSRFVSVKKSDLPYDADNKKLKYHGMVKTRKAALKSHGSGKLAPQEYRTYYVRLVTLDDDGKPIGTDSNSVIVRYGSYDEYYSSTYAYPELGISKFHFSDNPPSLSGEFHEEFAQSTTVCTDTDINCDNPWKTNKAWFRWKAPRMNEHRIAVWQISSRPFPSSLKSWANPPDLLDSGIVKDQDIPGVKHDNKSRYPGETYRFFKIDFSKAISKPVFRLITPQNVNTNSTAIKEKRTLYIRIIHLDNRGSVRGKPSAAAQLTIDNTKREKPDFPVLVSVQCTGLTVEILGYEPQRKANSDYRYHWQFVKDVPSNNMFYSFFSNYKKGDLIYLPPDDDDSFWEDVGDAFSSAFGIIEDLVNWASSAWDSVKGAVLNAVASVLSSTGLVDCGKGTTCMTLLSAALDTAMLACGIPPSLPNFDQIAEMGKDNLVKVISAQVAEQCGLPEDLTQMAAEQLAQYDDIVETASATADILLAEGQNAADRNYIFDGLLKPAPQRFDQPAKMLVRITNKGNSQSKRTKLLISDSLELFKGFSFNVSPLAPGEIMNTTVILEQDFSHVYDDALFCTRPYSHCIPNAGYNYTPWSDWWRHYTMLRDEFEVYLFGECCDCAEEIETLKPKENKDEEYIYNCTAQGNRAMLGLDNPSLPWGQPVQ